MIVLTATFFFLTIYAIVQDNLALFGIERSKAFSFKIIDTSAAASLFVTLMGALIVRHQFVLSLRPRISYTSKVTIAENPDCEGKFCKVWQVRIKNAGLGAAIFNVIQFRFGNKKTEDNPVLLTQSGLVDELAKVNLIIDQDYWLEFISNGFTLSPEKDCCLFEIKIEHVEKIKQLEAVVFFQGFLGESYLREISLVPQYR